MGGPIRLVGGKDVAGHRAKTGPAAAPPAEPKVARQLRGQNLLTDKTIAAWKRDGMKGALRDGQSLYLEGGARGVVGKIDYRNKGRENTYTVGRFGTGEGEFSLAAMRAERGKVRAWLDAGLDPNIQKRVLKARVTDNQGETFEKLGREFLEIKSAEWSRRHAEARRRLFERDLLPALGVLPVTDLDPVLALAALKRIEQRGAHEVAAKARILGSMIAQHGIVTGRMTLDPFQNLQSALKRPPVINRPTVSAKEMPQLFKALAKVPAEPATKLALLFQIACAVRPGEVRLATWSEVDLKGKLWRIEGERMKMRRDFVQPLSPLALEILKRASRLRQSRDDPSELLFRGFTTAGHLSEAAFMALLARCGYYGRQTAHGFRAAFKTWAGEYEPKGKEREFDPVAVELCLAHRPGGVEGVYNRGEYLPARRRILTIWGEQLETWGLRLP